MHARHPRPTSTLRSAAIVALAASALGLGCANQTTPPWKHRDNGLRAMKLGDYETAAQDLAVYAQQYPGNWETQYNLGLCLLELDRPADARRALEIAHTRRPDDPDVADALAEAMFRLDDPRQLFAFLNNRAETQRTVRAYLRLADYARLCGDPDAALTAVRMAIELNEVNPEGRTVKPYLMAAALAEEVGNVDVAIRRLRQAYGIDPYNGEVRERLVLLGEVPGPTIALPPGR